MESVGQTRSAVRVNASTTLLGSIVILSPGMYIVDMRSIARASPSEPNVMPSEGAAMCTPTRQLPLSSRLTEKASSISVVVASSILNALSSAMGSSGRTAVSTWAKSVPCGKFSNKKRSKWYACVEGIAPQRSSRCAGERFVAVQAASNALTSRVFRSGL